MKPTLTLYPYMTLGHANHGWLDARHHFSFARYWNPERIEFGTLRVINDDKIMAGAGFPPHGHDNMEIITYVRSGAITHRDSMGNEGVTRAGDVQVMSAGSGITHSEFNREKADTTLYQIWITPNKEDVAPRWEARQFPTDSRTNQLALLVSGQLEHEGQGALFIHQDAAIYGGRIAAGTRITQNLKHQGYILASYGTFDVEIAGNSENKIRMTKGDGAEIVGTKTVVISAAEESEILVIDVPE